MLYVLFSDELSVYVGSRTANINDAVDDLLESDGVRKAVSYPKLRPSLPSL